MNDAVMVLASLGGLSGVATLVTALANLSNTSKTAAQFKNNGGSTARDALDRIEKAVDLLTAEVKANTARINETNAAAAVEHSKMWAAISRPRQYQRRKR